MANSRRNKSTMSSSTPNAIENGTLITWTIKNFDMCPQQPSDYLRSPEFSDIVRQRAKFCIWLYPRGIKTDVADYVSVFIVKSASSKKEYDTVCRGELGIVTTNGKQCLFKFQDTLGLRAKGFSKFLNRANLSLTDGELTLYCTILDEGSADHRQTTSYDAELLKLSKAFGEAYEEGLLTDMELKTKGGMVRVHRAMIEARFPELMTMQNGGLVNIEEKATGALMRYIYTGRLKKNDMQFLNLIESAYLSSHMKSLLDVRWREIEAETILSRKLVSFRWEIKQFRTLTSDDVLWYSMPDSDISSWTWLNFSLMVFSNESSDRDDVLFSVTRHSRECKRIICRISALEMCKTFDHTFGEEDSWNIPAFARRGEVVDKVSDVASFLFEVSLTDGKSASCVNSTELSSYSTSFSDTVDDLELFRDDLENILMGGIYNDVVLVVGGHRISCHRFVLAARSRVFREMFRTSAAPHEVPIMDVKPESVESLLRYLYTGRINVYSFLTQNFELYELAKKYEIPSLKKEIVRQIKSLLSTDTLGEVLSAAYKWNDALLKECVFNFVCTFPMLASSSSPLQQVLRSRNGLALDLLNRVLFCLARKNNGRKEIGEPD